jgi:hypothetical protein
LKQMKNLKAEINKAIEIFYIPLEITLGNNLS